MFCFLFVVIFVLTFSDNVNLYPNSCIDLKDGTYEIKLIDGDDYPVITQKCSNGYTILDYSLDNNIEYYFKSFDQWHMQAWGPTNNDIINWEEWYLPDGGSNKNKYLLSPDCNTCDEDSDIQIHGSSTTYWMTGTIFGCFWINKGAHNCDVDYDTYLCSYCNSLFSQNSQVIGIDISGNSSTYDHTGICPTNVRSSDFSPPVSHYACTTSQGDHANLKPSIGGKGSFCVCSQPQTKEYYVSSSDNNKFKNINIENNNNIINDNSDDLVNIKLYSDDFKYGTYRITKSGTYTIMEDILFDFNNGDIDDPQADGSWWPTSDQSDDYPGAGITIETSNVILDLNGHTIAQSDNFYYQQRWFVGIELTSQYFLPGQGLGNFGPDPKISTDVIIKNGVIGLSSHHGIHGNNNKNIILQDLTVRDFETHGIQFNGFDNIELTNIEVGPSSNKVYFKGEYAHMRALLPRLRAIADETSGETIQFYNRDYTQTMEDIVDEIELKMNLVWNHVVQGTEYDETDEDWIDAQKLFYNEDGIPNGAAMYGIFLNTYGASVFTYNLYSKEFSTNAKLSNILIHDMTHRMDEYVTIREAMQPDIYINPITAPISVDDLFEDLSKLEYKGSVLTDAYLAMEYFTDNWYYLGAQVIGRTKLLKWALEGNKTAIGLSRTNEVQISCNYDVMIHSGKGINGLRLDGVKGVKIENIEIRNLLDKTKLGREDCGEYGKSVSTDFNNMIDGKPFGHFRQTAPMQVGFSGNMVQAMQINAAQNVYIIDSIITNLESYTGPTLGMAIWPSNTVKLGGIIHTYNLKAGSELDKGTLVYEDRPNKAPEACGIMIYSYYFYGQGFDKAFVTEVTKGQKANIKSWDILGHVGCLGSDSNPTMIGYGTKLNLKGSVSDYNSVNYDYLATYLLNLATSQNIQNSPDNNSNSSNNKSNLIPYITIFITVVFLSSLLIYYNKYCKNKNLNSEYSAVPNNDNSINSSYGSII